MMWDQSTIHTWSQNFAETLVPSHDVRNIALQKFRSASTIHSPSHCFPNAAEDSYCASKGGSTAVEWSKAWLLLKTVRTLTGIVSPLTQKPKHRQVGVLALYVLSGRRKQPGPVGAATSQRRLWYHRLNKQLNFRNCVLTNARNVTLRTLAAIQEVASVANAQPVLPN